MNTHASISPILVIFATLGAASAEDSEPLIGRYVAIDNVCAWPNLTSLRDGTIVATRRPIG